MKTLIFIAYILTNGGGFDSVFIVDMGPEFKGDQDCMTVLDRNWDKAERDILDCYYIGRED